MPPPSPILSSAATATFTGPAAAAAAAVAAAVIAAAVVAAVAVVAAASAAASAAATAYRSPVWFASNGFRANRSFSVSLASSNASKSRSVNSVPGGPDKPF